MDPQETPENTVCVGQSEPCRCSVFQVGQVVGTGVWIGTEYRPMGKGRIEKVHSGYCDVDICYPHAAPWIVGYHNADLRHV